MNKPKTPSCAGPPRCTIRHLSDLNLGAEELDLLRQQGTVCAEHRGTRSYFKLRFRRGRDCQCVRYLGSDPATAETIRAELRTLQRDGRRRRELQRLDSVARELLRKTKRDSAKMLEVNGYHYHGFAIRKRLALSTQTPKIGSPKTKEDDHVGRNPK
jgi:hypothetical protein